MLVSLKGAYFREKKIRLKRTFFAATVTVVTPEVCSLFNYCIINSISQACTTFYRQRTKA